MIPVPSVLDGLIERMEAGDDPTPEELRRAQRLQALHLAKAGEDYLRESLEQEQAADEQFKQSLGVQ